MPKLQPEDPKNLHDLLARFGTADLNLDVEEVIELLDHADEEIREAEWDLKGQFPNGVLKSAEMAVLKMALALALGYCRRLAKRDEFDHAKGQRAHRNAALLLWFWTIDSMPSASPVAEQLVNLVTARNDYGYEGRIVSLTEAEDYKDVVKQMRVELGDAPIRQYHATMAAIVAAQQADGNKGT